jgi:hypothetical protein
MLSVLRMGSKRGKGQVPVKIIYVTAGKSRQIQMGAQSMSCVTCPRGKLSPEKQVTPSVHWPGWGRGAQARQYESSKGNSLLALFTS